MSGGILSKLFTTRRALELEYRKVSLLRESRVEYRMAARIDETGELSVMAELASFADAIWQ
jgi:hypothetical protein